MSVFLHWTFVWFMVFGLGAWLGWGLTYAWHLDQEAKRIRDETRKARLPFMAGGFGP